MSGLFRLSVALVLVLVLFCAGAFIYQNNNNRLGSPSEPAVVIIPNDFTINTTDDYDNYISENTSFAEMPEIEQDKIAELIEKSDNLENENLILSPESTTSEILSETKEFQSAANITQLPIKTPVTTKVILDKIQIDTPLIAIVIDDMGINLKRTKDIIGLNAPLTSSFLTYGHNLKELADKARAAGHEIMIHTPMEPKVAADLAPDTLKVDMDDEQIETSFSSMLKEFEQIPVRGINNHMGSKFTENKEKLSHIMNILKQHDMYFLDSKTTSKSKGKELAIETGIDYASRDVFLDNKNNYAYIMEQLDRAETIAHAKGFCIAIGHPKSATYQALKDWIQKLPEKNLKLVHISEIIKLINQ